MHFSRAKLVRKSTEQQYIERVGDTGDPRSARTAAYWILICSEAWRKLSHQWMATSSRIRDAAEWPQHVEHISHSRHHTSPRFCPPPAESLWVYALLAARRMAIVGKNDVIHKPEVHNVLCCRQRRTEPRPQVTSRRFGRPFVRPMLSDRCLSVCPVCPVCLSVTLVYWPNGWMNQDET